MYKIIFYKFILFICLINGAHSEESHSYQVLPGGGGFKVSNLSNKIAPTATYQKHKTATPSLFAESVAYSHYGLPGN